MRLDPRGVATFLADRGFRTVRMDRYAMLYRHVPGRPMRALSLPGIYHLAVKGYGLLDFSIGRVGNKMVVIAQRP